MDPEPKGAEGRDCLKGSGRTRAAVPNVLLGDVREAKLRVRDPTCLSMRRRSDRLRYTESAESVFPAVGSKIVYGNAISRLLDECLSIFGITSSSLMDAKSFSTSAIPLVFTPLDFWLDVSRKCTRVASEY